MTSITIEEFYEYSYSLMIAKVVAFFFSEKIWYGGYGKFQEETNDVISSNKNNHLVVKFKLMLIKKKP